MEKAGGELRIALFEGEYALLTNDLGENPSKLRYEVDKSVLLTGILVPNTEQVRSVEVYQDETLVHLCRNESATGESVRLTRPVACLPGHTYTVSLDYRELPDTWPVRGAVHTSPVRVLQLGLATGLLLQVQTEEGEVQVKECLWRLWQCSENAEACEREL